jgi:hypothetical protein
MPRVPTFACGLAVGDGWMHEPTLDGYRLLRPNVGSRWRKSDGRTCVIRSSCVAGGVGELRQVCRR